VVFGGGAAENSPDVLDRMRMATAERAAPADKAPGAELGGKGAAAEPGGVASGQGSAGFTQLLRTLGSAPAAPAALARETPAMEKPRSTSDSGFTSLLQKLSTPGLSGPAEETMRTPQPAPRAVPEEPKRAPAAPGASGFTELLRTVPGGAKDFAGPQAQPPRTDESSFAGGAAGAPPVRIDNGPGAFTKMFGTFGGAGASSSTPAPVERGTGDSASGSPGSFTRMFSVEQQSSAGQAPAYEERKSAAGNLEFGPALGTAGSAAPSRDPFSQSLPETQPIQGTPPSSGVGITRLIQMLDGPSKAPLPPMESAPASAPPAEGPGAWTQTFASLGKSEAAAPATNVPEWASPQAAPPAPAPAVPREASFPNSFNQPAVSASAAPAGSTGPSEFTRILDASRMREMAMRGGQPAGSGTTGPAPPQSVAPVPAPPQMPGYSVPPPPPMGGMPQPGGYAPPQPPPAPGYPMSYPPHAGALPGGSMPQQPAMYAPPPPPMPAPQPPAPPKPAEPGMGKMQQFVPLLLVLIIVLLVVLIVTVIFLMKH